MTVHILPLTTFHNYDVTVTGSHNHGLNSEGRPECISLIDKLNSQIIASSPSYLGLTKAQTSRAITLNDYF